MRIKGVGPHTAKIAIVGEAYGAAEEKAGKPFVGRAGWELDKLLHSCQIKREDLYITNVVNERPPGNNFQAKYYKNGKPTPELCHHTVELHTELAMLPLLEKVICLGKEATYAMTNKGTEIYGYWTPVHFKGMNQVWVMPTFHPATIFRSAKIKETDGTSSTYNTRQIIAFHLMKAKRSPQYDEYETYIISGEDHYTHPLDDIKQPKGPVAVDIEVLNKEIVCIGWSINGEAGVCVDLRKGYQVPHEVEWIKKVLANKKVAKIFHNAPYDIPWLTLKLGWEVNNFCDTMVIQKSLFPDMPKSLKFCTGMHTNLPYWKDDLKIATETVKGEIDWEQLFTYNCMDVIATYKDFQSMMAYAGDKFPHLWEDKKLMEATMQDMILGGINVDFNQMKKELGEKLVESEETKARLDEAFGCNVNSTKQLGEYAEKAGLLGKTPKRTATGKLQMNAEVLEKLAKTNEKFKEILQWKKKNKLISTYYKTTPDPTGKWHCTFNILTKTGRFTSSSSAFGNGYNLQNVPSSVRHLFVPTEGWRFCSVDLKSGDNTVFAALIGDDLELDLIASGKSPHTVHASQIFGYSEMDIDIQDAEKKEIFKKDQSWRQMAKKMCHAANYGAQYTTIASALGIKRAEAKVLMSQWFTIHPQIRQYHEWVADQLRTKGYLTTPLGRRREFLLAEGERILEDAIAYIPQSTCTGVLNEGYMEMKRKGMPIRAVLQEHDGMLYEFDPKIYSEDGLRRSLFKAHVFPVDITSPLDGKTRTIEIGITVSFGDTWKEAG